MPNKIIINLYGAFIEHFPGFVSIRDEECKLVYANDDFKNWMARYTDVDIIGLTNLELAAHIDSPVASILTNCHDLEMRYKHDQSVNNRVVDYTENGETFYIDILKFKCQENGKFYIFTLGKDITKIYKEIAYHKALSRTDPLTAVGNRNLLDETTFEDDDLFIYADLDNFKVVNDIYGHGAGDKILVDLSKMLTDMFRAQDRIIRMGGDEFLIVVKTVTKNESFNNEVDANARVEALRNEFRRVFSSFPQLGISIGYSRFSVNVGHTLEIIDARMYEDKKLKRQRLA